MRGRGSNLIKAFILIRKNSLSREKFPNSIRVFSESGWFQNYSQLRVSRPSPPPLLRSPVLRQLSSSHETRILVSGLVLNHSLLGLTLETQPVAWIFNLIHSKHKHWFTSRFSFSIKNCDKTNKDKEMQGFMIWFRFD